MLCALQSAHTDMLPTFKYQFIFDVRVPFVTFSIFGILMMVCQQKVLLQPPAPLQTLLPFMHLQSIIGLMEPGLMIFDVHLNLAFFSDPAPCLVMSRYAQVRPFLSRSCVIADKRANFYKLLVRRVD